MNYNGISKSNYVKVTDREAFEELEEELHEKNLAYFRSFWDGDRVAIGSDDGPMYLEYPEGFFSRLAEILEEPMIIRSVGFEGMRHVPDAWQWIVYPSGEVETIELPELSEVLEE